MPDRADRLPFVSVIIPCRNEGAHIDTCLTDLTRNQDYQGPLEFLIAEGGSSDDTPARLEAWAQRDARIRIIANPEAIVPTGLNRCIRAARGEIILRADVHSIYAQDYISTCISELLRTGADNVGGAARPAGDAILQRAFALAVLSPFSLGGASSRDADREGWVDTVQYGCWWRSLFDRVGLFDEELVRNQDDELNLRIQMHGGRIWQSRRICSYLYPRSRIKPLFKQYFQYGYWKPRVIRKHGRPASLRHLVPALFVLGMTLLAAGAVFDTRIRWAFLAALGIYGSVLLVESFRVALKHSVGVMLAVAVVIATLHFSYGSGFLLGSLREVRRGRAPGKAQASA
jgi:succinoglycan biosynthesis protein ExoA